MSDAPMSSPAPAPAKLDPESLVLRGAPVRVTRFRRGAIVTIAAAGSIAVAGITWLALKPPSLTMVARGEARQIATRSPAEALAGAPTSYGDVPQLGPPLPGDLGRPILEHQRAIAEQGPSGNGRNAAAEAEAERQRIAAELRTARESGVMMQLANTEKSLTPTGAMEGEAQGAPEAYGEQPAMDAGQDPNGQRRKNALVGRANGGDDLNPHTMVRPASPWTLHAGTVIAASLITGLNSDLPGLVTAQVTQNTYDSVTGRTLLVPQGSRLIGSYDSVVAYGQSRALVVWQRIILPDGSSIRIDNVPATDTQGYAGLSDRIDRHTWQLLKGVTLSTLLGVATELSWGNTDDDLVRAIREASQQSGARAGDQLVSRSLDIQPTLRVRPGSPLMVVVHKDIVLRPWAGSGA